MSALSPRPGILEIAPYVGGESSIPGVAKAIKLSSNESALGPSPKATAAYKHVDLGRYPDGGATELRNALGKRFGLDPERIVCGAGSDDVIHLLALAYAGPGDEVIYNQHGFLLYPIAARSVGAVPVPTPERNLTADVDAFLAAVTPRTKIVFVANPNNPTGTYIPRSGMARLRRELPPHVLLVIDAAYAEYVERNDYSPGSEFVDAGDNVAMTRTFSKIFGLAALRLGWAYCPPAMADILNRIRNPFSASAAAIAAGVAAVEDWDHVTRVLRHTHAWKAWTEEKLMTLGYQVLPTVANFLLVRFPAEPGRDVDAADAALKKHGIIARRVAKYGLPDCLRITVGRASEMRALVKALREFKANA
ncbi:MAG: histidinol-phosphate transaminase [Rhodospirillales bacterium]|nr:histidinol-phosphate transaminase [Rhodospirillales bacterium]